MAAGVELSSNGLIEVDDRLRTSAPGVWAIGDLVAGPALAHKASEEGILAAEDAAGLELEEAFDYRGVPAVAFTRPQVASFGPNEEELRNEGTEIVVGQAPLSSVGAPVIYGEGPGLVKVIADRTTGEIVAATVVSSRASELIQEVKAARDFEAGLADIARSTHAHPTYSEAILEAARAGDGWLIHG